MTDTITTTDTEIDWSQDIIDLRYVLAVRSNLKLKQDDLTVCINCAGDIELEQEAHVHTETGQKLCYPDLAPHVQTAAEPVGDELEEWEQETLKAIEELDGQLSTGLENWAQNQPTLINDNYWVEFAQEWVEEIGDIPDYLTSYIDWEAWADHLAMEYTQVEVDEKTFYIRTY